MPRISIQKGRKSGPENHAKAISGFIFMKREREKKRRIVEIVIDFGFGNVIR